MAGNTQMSNNYNVAFWRTKAEYPVDEELISVGCDPEED